MPDKQQKDIDTRKRTQAENPINGGIQRPSTVKPFYSS